MRLHPAAWRADPGWQTLIRALALRNLGPDEGRAYLSQRRIPVDQHAQVLAFTHGHPLALSLVADTFAQRTEAHTFLPEESPDLIRTLLEKFVQKVPGPAHRAPPSHPPACTCRSASPAGPGQRAAAGLAAGGHHLAASCATRARRGGTGARCSC